MSRARHPAVKGRDRKVIGDLFLEGKTFRTIHEETGVSIATICRDMKKNMEDWKKQTTIDIDEAKIIEINKLNRLEAEFWDGWIRSCKDKKRAVRDRDQAITKDEKGKKKVVTVGIKTKTEKIKTAGDPRFLFGALKCCEQRCKILKITDADINVYQKMTFYEFVKQYSIKQNKG